MPHVVLLGDSILDNRAYVGSEPPVIAQVQGLLPGSWKATLLAVDGSIAAQVVDQLRGLPPDATHLVISAGGNNALLNSDVVTMPVANAAEVFMRMREIARDFEEEYRIMVEAALARGLPITLCTVYNPNMPDQQVQQLMVAGLVVFNDVILRTAFRHGLTVIDLRLVCTTPADFANEIEPSAIGGAKIAAQIVAAVTGAAGGAPA